MSTLSLESINIEIANSAPIFGLVYESPKTKYVYGSQGVFHCYCQVEEGLKYPAKSSSSVQALWRKCPASRSTAGAWLMAVISPVPALPPTFRMFSPARQPNISHLSPFLGRALSSIVAEKLAFQVVVVASVHQHAAALSNLHSSVTRFSSADEQWAYLKHKSLAFYKPLFWTNCPQWSKLKRLPAYFTLMYWLLVQERTLWYRKE